MWPPEHWQVSRVLPLTSLLPPFPSRLKRLLEGQLLLLSQLKVQTGVACWHTASQRASPRRPAEPSVSPQRDEVGAVAAPLSNREVK